VEHLQKLAIIAVVNLIVYYRTLFFGYVGDDVERSERPQEFKNRYHRWWIQFIGLKHINSMVAHAISIGTHTICCIMIYLALGRNNVSFLAALLFSINPVNMQGSIWISGRNYVTSSILALGMFLFPYCSWIFYIGTSHFAVNAWFAPLAFLGTPYWYMVGIIPVVWLVTSNNKATLKRKLWETGGLKTTNSEMRAVKLRKIIPFVKTYLYYFVLAVVPFRLGIEHNFIRGFGTNETDNKKGYRLDKFFWAGAVLFITVCGASLYCIFNGWHPALWGLFWFTVNIAMWCNFVTYQQQIAERYIFLANIGMMYALANLIIAYPILITAFIVGYLVRLLYVQDMYLNDYWAVEYTIMESKELHYMWLMRAVKKFMVRDYVGSLFDLREAYKHKPYDLKVLYNLAVVFFMLGDLVNAKEFVGKARANIYDELEESIEPSFKQLEDLIKQVEEAKEKGETQVQVDLSKVMVVK